MVPETADWAGCCELAGALAERGVARVLLSDGEGGRALDARATDLPRALFEAAPGSRLAWEGGEAERGPQGWRIVGESGPAVQG